MKGKILERISSARRLMEKDNIDALIIMNPLNLYYMSGWMPSVLSRPIIEIISLENETTLIFPELESPTAKKYGHLIQKFISYSEEKYDVVEAASRSLKKIFIDMSITRDRVGIDMNFPVRYYHMLQKSFPEIEQVDAASIVSTLRMIKSEEEIKLIKKAAELTGIGMEAILNAEEVGKRELELNAEGNYAVHTNGSMLYPEFAIGVSSKVLSGHKAAHPHEVSTGKRLKEGEVIRNSCAVLVNGYRAGCSRPTCIGKPTSVQRDIFEAACEEQRKGLELVKPGTKVSDIHEKMREFRVEAGFGRYPQHRNGGGIGLHYHEPPYLRSSDDTKLAPNMVITVLSEISALDISVGQSVADTVLVTSDGHDVLNKFRKDTM